MGGDPVPIIHDIRSLLEIGINYKTPREDYLGEWLSQDPALDFSTQFLTTLSPHSLNSLPFPPADVYVFGVGPLVSELNINALASKKDKEQHVFRVKDMENLEDVFIQMLGMKLGGGSRDLACSPSHPSGLTFSFP